MWNFKKNALSTFINALPIAIIEVLTWLIYRLN